MVAGAVVVVVVVVVSVVELVLEESVPLSLEPHAAVNELSAIMAATPATTGKRRAIRLSVIVYSTLCVDVHRNDFVLRLPTPR